jgi:hypothetical protein
MAETDNFYFSFIYDSIKKSRKSEGKTGYPEVYGILKDRE